MSAILVKRYYYNNCYIDNDGDQVCPYSAWNDWVRWLVVGLIIAAALFLFFLFSCITARRRRRLGYEPYRGTAWTLGRNNQPSQYAQQPYYNNGNNPAPPAYYAPPPPQESGYYGPQRNVELQSPQPVYGGTAGAKY